MARVIRLMLGKRKSSHCQQSAAVAAVIRGLKSSNAAVEDKI